MLFRMRIAIVRTDTSVLDLESYNCQELGLAKALARRGHQVDVYLNGPEYEIEIGSEGDPLRCVKLSRSPSMRIPLIQQSVNLRKIRQVCSGKYDFVQINESNEIESYILSAKLYRRRIPNAIYQGMYRDLTGRIQKLLQFVFRCWALPRMRKTVDLVFAKTDSADRFIRSKGFSQVVTLPVGLDNQIFDSVSSANWRDELEISRTSKIVLYVGKLEPRRNTWLMMSLAEKMQGSDVVFVFAGTGVDFELVKKHAANSNLTNVRFLGSVPQRKMRSLYEEAYCLMLASDYEIYGMVILEAMYLGVPVVTTRTAGAEQIIMHNEDGIVLDGVDEDVWMEALTSLIDDQERRSRLANKARAKIVDAYTWDNIAERYELIISSICLR